MDLGMTEACAKIWVYDAIHDSSECGLTCAKDLKTPYNLPPDCRLNSCLQCDEDRAGPNFKTFAGRTRRRSGLASAIQRPARRSRGASHTCHVQLHRHGGGELEAPDQPLALPTAAPAPTSSFCSSTTWATRPRRVWQPNNTSPPSTSSSRGLRFTLGERLAYLHAVARVDPTGRYAVHRFHGQRREYRVVPTPASPGGLDPRRTSAGEGAKGAGYATGMAAPRHRRQPRAPAARRLSRRRTIATAVVSTTPTSARRTPTRRWAMDPTTGVSDRFGERVLFLMATRRCSSRCASRTTPPSSRASPQNSSTAGDQRRAPARRACRGSSHVVLPRIRHSSPAAPTATAATTAGAASLAPTSPSSTTASVVWRGLMPRCQQRHARLPDQRQRAVPGGGEHAGHAASGGGQARAPLLAVCAAARGRCGRGHPDAERGGVACADGAWRRGVDLVTSLDIFPTARRGGRLAAAGVRDRR